MDETANTPGPSSVGGADVPTSPEIGLILPKSTLADPKPQKIAKFKPGLFPVQGRQVVKGYSVTEDQLETLSALGYQASISFTIASGLLGFALNLMVTIDMTADAPIRSVNFWGGVEASCFLGALLFGVTGLIFALRRWWKVSDIKSKTKFEGE